MSGDA